MELDILIGDLKLIPRLAVTAYSNIGWHYPRASGSLFFVDPRDYDYFDSRD